MNRSETPVDPFPTDPLRLPRVDLFQALPLPLAFTDLRGRILRTNPAFERVFPNAASMHGLAESGADPAASAFDFETIPLPGREVALHCGRDRAVEAQLRRQISQMERLAAIGRLVSGVAHEINNPLTSIVGYAEILAQEGLDAAVRQKAQALHAQAERARRIVRSFLNVVVKTTAQRTPFSLNHTVADAIALRRDDPHPCAIQIPPDLAGDLPLALGDAGQIEQVVLNLLVNAEDAVGDLGAKAEIRLRTFELNGRARLEITDNGRGIRAEDMTRIFDPFFTTKAAPDGRSGTGIGLSICAEIVKDHGGQLYAWSIYGAGSTFVLELPLAGPEDLANLLPPRPDAGRSLHGKAIMVVDDDPAVTAVIDELLSRCGATVDYFNSPGAALDQLCMKPYDAILCDQRMPRLNGESFYRIVETLDAELSRRFIFMTGDVLNERTRRLLEETDNRSIRKPFRLEELLAAIEAVI